MIETGNCHFFEPWEFERGGVQWWHKMSPRLLIMLDVFRFQWGKPVHVSTDAGAVGRSLGQQSMSQHNVDRWCEVRAVDIQPDGINDREDLYRAFVLACELGFTGVGVYPHWHRPGLHVDVRHDRQPGFPITWGQVMGAAGPLYVSAHDALETMS